MERSGDILLVCWLVAYPSSIGTFFLACKSALEQNMKFKRGPRQDMRQLVEVIQLLSAGINPSINKTDENSKEDQTYLQDGRTFETPKYLIMILER